MGGECPFPGRHAGASLKQTSRAMTRHGGLCGFPRQTRRGLIEAWKVASVVPSAMALSPADTPGPH